MMLKKSLASLAILSLLSSPVFSESSSFLAPLAKKSLLLDIAQSDSQMMAVGERGHVLLSDDQGQNWKQVSVPTTSTLTAVTSVGDNIWAVGHDSTIIASRDAGKTWQIQQFLPELERPLMDVAFFDANHGIAIGSYGVFFRTTDGGENWTREYHTSFLHPDDQDYLEELKQEDEAFYLEEMASILPHLNRVNLDGDALLIAGETGLLAKSSDQGKSWERLESGYMGSFFDVTQTSKGEVLAAGLRGNIYRSNTLLDDWQRVDSDTTATFNSIVKLSDTDEFLLVGNNGTLLWYSPEGKQLNQTEDGKSVLNAVMNNGQITAVSAVGIKPLSR